MEMQATFSSRDKPMDASFGGMTQRTVVGVEVIDEIKEGDMRAITSNAVYVGVGNIEALLHTL